MKNIAKEVLKTLNSHGYEAYVVGGFVRDFLLGKKSYDIDVTTNATPEQVIEVFDKVIPTGIKHGTVTAIVRNVPIEITTFRNDGDYLDNRRPESVVFSSNIKDDIIRRDFTINSFLMDHNLDIIDLLDAKGDLDNKIIKTIGDPNKRFNEDALRMLRAIRFVSKLGFEIEKDTFEAIRNNASLLSNVSIERIKLELGKIFLGKHYNEAKILLEEIKFPIIDFVYPKEVNTALEAYSMLYIDNLFNISEWKFSNEESNFITTAKHIINSNLDAFEIYKVTNFEKYYWLVEKLLGVKVRLFSENIIKTLPIRGKSDIMVDGLVVMGLGFYKKDIGIILNDIEKKIVFKELENDKQILIDYIRRNYDKNKRVN